MTLEPKKILHWGLGILVALLFCIGICGNKPYVSAECQKLVNGFQVYLDTSARDIVDGTAGRNPDVLELKAKATMIECISDTKVKLKVDTRLKVQITVADPETKKTITVVQCGAGSDEVTIERKGANISTVDDDKEIAPMKIVPCK